MADDKIAIIIEPTPGTDEIPETDIQKLANIIKRPAEKIQARLSSGKAITIITPETPLVPQLLTFLKSVGFSVTTTSPSAARRAAASVRLRTQKSGRTKRKRPTSPTDMNEWQVNDVIESLYEVKDIKRGGMGAVYIVHHTRWNTMMAVKSLLRHLRDSQEDRSLFVKEAETWIDIGFHPNIAACYYVRNILDSPRIFIEYVDSGSLFELIRSRKPMGWDMIIDLMVQVSDGLAHAHLKGLVHRDVKPANCMLTSDGMVKVTDFGLTKRKGQKSTTDAADISITDLVVRDSNSVTAAGMGTPSYMAPEMWIAESDIGPQVDVYAFGVMFFEMCCGRKPFFLRKGEKRDKLIAAHLEQPPPHPRTLRPDVPEKLEQIVLKCLNKDPGDRYSSFKDIRHDLVDAYETMFKRTYPRYEPDEVRLAADALNNKAVSLMDLNHHEQAEEILKKAVESDPHHPEAVYNIGLLEWYRSSNPNRDLVIKLEEVIKTPEYVGRGAHLLGRCLLALGDTKQAVKACELSLHAEDASEDRLKHCAIALIGTGQEEEAITQLKKYRNSFPVDDDSAGWLIGALLRSGHNEEAQNIKESLPKGSQISALTLEEIANRFLISTVEEIMTLTGHKGWITCMTRFPQSSKMITGSRDRSLKVWDTTTGEEVASFPVLGEPPASLWISPDERLVVVLSDKPGIPVRILNLESGLFVGNLPGFDGLVTTVSFSNDGKRILTVENKGSVRIWDSESFKAMDNYKVPMHSAAASYFENDESPTIFVAAQDRTIKRIKPAESDILKFARSVEERVISARISRDGTMLLTGAKDKQAIVWDASTGDQISVCNSHEDQVNALAVNSARNLAASYDTKVGIKVWDTGTGMVNRTFQVHDSEIYCLEFTQDGDRLLAGGRDMVVKVWDVRGQPIWPEMALAKIRSITKQMVSDRQYKSMLDGAKKSMARGGYSKAYMLVRNAQQLPGYERSDSSLDLIFRMRDKGARVGLHGGWKRKSIETPSSVMGLALSSSAISFLTAHSDHTIGLYSVKKGDCVNVLQGHSNLVASVDFAPNGREAASASDDRTVRIWELPSGKNSAIFKGHSDSVTSLAYSRDGRMVISGSWDSTVKVWGTGEGNVLRTLKGHQDKVSAVAITADGKIVVSGSYDGVVKIWDNTTGKLIRDLGGHQNRVTSVRISPLGQTCATSSVDGTVKIWKIDTGRELALLEVDEKGVRDLDFSDDGKFLLTGGADSVVRIWQIDSKECLREFQGHTNEVTAVRFSLNGRYAVSSSLDGFVNFWELDWDWEFPVAQ